uniref:Condensin complex subunit 1 C-terminal domain-containing protein n=1 Tax=Romanomermis culicivorax TaxID=13658 RepID=A0A915HMH8_ROMCU
MVPCMKAFGECIREGPMELRSRHIEALTNMFLVEPENLSNERILSITEIWMTWMKRGTIDDSITFLFDVLRRPIPEIRRTICALFKKLILLHWALPKILSQEGFIDFIAAPLNEREAEFNIFRHEFVDTVLKSESIS